MDVTNSHFVTVWDAQWGVIILYQLSHSPSPPLHFGRATTPPFGDSTARATAIPRQVLALHLPPPCISSPSLSLSNILFKMAQSTAHRRLLTEYKSITNNPPDGITAGPVSEDDLLHWECLIQGPEDTPFEGGVFPAELKFPKDYPLAPPTMKFLTDVWHPNGAWMIS